MSKANDRSPLFSFRYLAYDFIKITGALPGLLWFRPKILYENKEAKKKIRGGALLIANHRGFFDPVYLQVGIWYRRHRFVCLSEFLTGPYRWLFRCFLCIPVDKKNFNFDSFRQIVDHLQKEELVVIFPEGQVNDGSGVMAQFKSGMVLMACRSGKPIVPVYIRHKTRWYQRLVLAVGEPVDVRGQYGAMPSLPQMEEIAARLRQKEEYLENMTVRRK